MHFEKLFRQHRILWRLYITGELGAEAADDEGTGFQQLNDAATISWNYGTGDKKMVTLSGNRTLEVSGTQDGDAGLLLVTQDATGSRTLTLPGQTASGETLSSGAGTRSLLGFVNVAGTLMWSISQYAALPTTTTTTSTSTTSTTTAAPTTTTTTTAAAGATLASTTWFTRHDPAQEVTTRVDGADTFVSALGCLAQANASFNLTQSTTTMQPELIASGINGLPSIELNSGLQLLSGSWTTALTKPFTKIAVIQWKTVPASVKYALYSFSTAARGDYGHWSDLKHFSYAGASLKSVNNAVVDQKIIVWLEFVGDGATDKIYINGNLDTTGNAGTHVAPVGCRLGEGTTATGHVWVGDHLIYAGIMSAEDRTSITNELKTKYGIA